MDLPQLPQWTPSDAAGVKQFLSTPLGARWMGFLMNGKPRIVVDRGTEVAALTGAHNAGYELCIQLIYGSCTPTEQPDVNIKSFDMTRD
jgi:hypothetical protein